jgi:redox-sensitive bicupin YhaK (pirin superfamily)
MLAELEIYSVDSKSESPVRRVLPKEGTAYFDPFLVFHEQGPIAYGPREAIGFPEHPHRGFETVTYMLAGEQQHLDSFGHAGILKPGDVQWMTAGRGIIHTELPSPRVYHDGGLVHGIQVWINLPASRKMQEPRYQEVNASALPVVVGDRSWVRIIAGTDGTSTSPIDTGRPMLFAHLRLRPGGSHRFLPAAGATVIVYSIAGAVRVGARELELPAMHVGAVRGHLGELLLRAGADPFEGIVMAALPLNEPVVARGPFVMNTVREIEAAFDDLVAGRFGVPARANGAVS